MYGDDDVPTLKHVREASREIRNKVGEDNEKLMGAVLLVAQIAKETRMWAFWAMLFAIAALVAVLFK